MTEREAKRILRSAQRFVRERARGKNQKKLADDLLALIEDVEEAQRTIARVARTENARVTERLAQLDEWEAWKTEELQHEREAILVAGETFAEHYSSNRFRWSRLCETGFLIEGHWRSRWWPNGVYERWDPPELEDEAA